MRLRMVLAGLAVALVIAGAGAAFLASVGGGVLVRDPRIVASEHSPTDAKLFLTIENTGGETDRLIGVSTDMAWGCGFHGPTAAQGATPYITVPAGQTIELGPETAYIDLSDIGEPVQAGQMAPMILVFEKAGEVLVKARVDELLTGEAARHGAGLFDPAAAGEAAPVLELSAEVLEDRRVRLSLALENFAFDEAGVDGPHREGRGHAHLYIDNVKIGRLYEPEFLSEPLAPGAHQFAVTLNTNDHRAYARDGAAMTRTLRVVIP